MIIPGGDLDGWEDSPYDPEDDLPDVDSSRHLSSCTSGTQVVTVGYYLDTSNFRVGKTKYWIKDSNGNTLASKEKSADIVSGRPNNVNFFMAEVCRQTEYRTKVKLDIVLLHI